MKEPKPTTLDPAQSLKLIKIISPYASRCHRLIEYLSQNKQAPSGHVANACSIGNISDTASDINPSIYKEGYFIGCEKPLVRILNKFGEPSNEHLWSIYKVD